MYNNNTVTEEEIKHRIKDNTQEIRDLTDKILFLEDNQRKQNKIIKGLEENFEIQNSVIEDLEQRYKLLLSKVNAISTNLTQKNKERIFQLSRHLKK